MFSYSTVHTQQSTVPPGVAEHNVTVARAFTKLMGAFVTFWNNDAGSKIHLLANPGQDVAPIGAARQDAVADAAGQLAVPAQSYEGMKGALEHFEDRSAGSRMPGQPFSCRPRSWDIEKQVIPRKDQEKVDISHRGGGPVFIEKPNILPLASLA